MICLVGLPNFYMHPMSSKRSLFSIYYLSSDPFSEDFSLDINFSSGGRVNFWEYNQRKIFARFFLTSLVQNSED